MALKAVAVLLLAAATAALVVLASGRSGPSAPSAIPADGQHREAAAPPPALAPASPPLPALPTTADAGEGSSGVGASADPAAVARKALREMAEIRARKEAATQAAADAVGRELQREMAAFPDPEFWKLLKQKTWREALAYLDERLAGTHDQAWLRGNAMGATVAMREAPPWEALDALVDVFARVCSAALPPKPSPPTPGHSIWRDSLQAGHVWYFEAALADAVHFFDRRSDEADFSEFLAVRVVELAGLLTDEQRADPAVHTLVEFVRLNAAIAYSEDARREGSAATAVRLLPRIRTFVEAERGLAAERVKPMVDWVRAWYPGAVSVPAEDPPEGTPLPALRERATSRSPFARGP